MQLPTKQAITLSLIVIAMVLQLNGCSFTKTTPAPITDLRNQIAEQQGYHIVQRGETLYFIAWRFGKDFRQLAAINKLPEPYNLIVGTKIYLKGKTQYYSYQQKGYQKPEKHESTTVPTQIPIKHWLMPAKGIIINKFSANNKGINIAGSQAEPIRATAAGVVVYAGSGLRAYGNLLIIKHNDLYLSAYAHNQTLLVKEGQRVKAGQRVATMGSTGTNRIMLHFELRKRGKPVNPLNYIKQ